MLFLCQRWRAWPDASAMASVKAKCSNSLPWAASPTTWPTRSRHSSSWCVLIFHVSAPGDFVKFHTVDVLFRADNPCSAGFTGRSTIMESCFECAIELRFPDAVKLDRTFWKSVFIRARFNLSQYDIELRRNRSLFYGTNARKQNPSAARQFNPVHWLIWFLVALIASPGMQRVRAQC